MAWYYGTFSCGCEGRVNVIGKMSDRGWKVDKAFEKMCEECYQKHLLIEREKKLQKAKEEAQEMELPALEGSEKQIEWAYQLRQKLIDTFDSYEKRGFIENIENVNSNEDILEILDYILINRTDSKYYIDKRHNSISYYIELEAENVFKSDQEKIEELELKELIREGTVAPSKAVHDGIVYINFSKETNKITLDYKKDDNFISLVKCLRYTWNGIWYRKISSYLCGTIEDRVAEIGNRLLNEGYTISIVDDFVREKAINADFEKECDNWILILDDKKIKIIWNGKNDKLYEAARRLKTSKWENGCVSVKISEYNDIRDFAETYEFKISDKAQMLLSKFEEEYKSLKTVEVVNRQEKASKDKLSEILNSSKDILEDLIDD